MPTKADHFIDIDMNFSSLARTFAPRTLRVNFFTCYYRQFVKQCGLLSDRTNRQNPYKNFIQIQAKKETQAVVRMCFVLFEMIHGLDLHVFSQQTAYAHIHRTSVSHVFNPLKPELNSICYLLALLAHHFLHVSRIRVKSLTLR